MGQQLDVLVTFGYDMPFPRLHLNVRLGSDYIDIKTNIHD